MARRWRVPAGCYLLGGVVIGRRGGRQVGHEEARERGAWARPDKRGRSRSRSRRLYLYCSSPWTVDRAGRKHGSRPAGIL